MSWEGHYQIVCKNGHYYEQNAFFEEPRECPTCNESPDWSHRVDDTNGCEDRGDGHCSCGAINMAPFIKTPATSHICPSCNQTHQCAPTYYTPWSTVPHTI